MHIDQSKFVPVRHKCILFNHFSLCTLNNTSLRQHGLFNKHGIIENAPNIFITQGTTF